MVVSTDLALGYRALCFKRQSVPDKVYTPVINKHHPFGLFSYLYAGLVLLTA